MFPVSQTLLHSFKLNIPYSPKRRTVALYWLLIPESRRTASVALTPQSQWLVGLDSPFQTLRRRPVVRGSGSSCPTPEKASGTTPPKKPHYTVLRPSPFSYYLPQEHQAARSPTGDRGGHRGLNPLPETPASSLIRTLQLQLLLQRPEAPAMLTSYSTGLRGLAPPTPASVASGSWCAPTAACPPTSHSCRRRRVPSQPTPHRRAGRCPRHHLRRRPTRNVFLLAPASPPDPGALRARGKLLLPLGQCVTSCPNPRKGRTEASRSGSESRVAPSFRSAQPGAGAVAPAACICGSASARKARLCLSAAQVSCASPQRCPAIAQRFAVRTAGDETVKTGSLVFTRKLSLTQKRQLASGSQFCGVWGWGLAYLLSAL